VSFNVLTIRTGEFNEGSMYPVLGDDHCPIELETLDGGGIDRLVASELRVGEFAGGGVRNVVRATKIRADVLVTDARIAVACDKYDKGGGWWGIGTGAVVAVGINVVSRAMAAHRRKGKLLVGHVRYPWLIAVGGSPKQGMLDSEQLRLTLMDATGGTKRRLAFDLTLPSSFDSLALAQAIVQRAARYRLAHTPVDTDKEHAELERLAHAPRLAAEPKKFSLYTLPTFFNAMPLTAYPKATEPQCASPAEAISPAAMSGSPAAAGFASVPLPSGPVPTALPPATASTGVTVFCTSCGTRRKIGAHFCIGCGDNLASAAGIP